MTLLGMIFGQPGIAFAVHTQRALLRSLGVLSNRYLLVGIAGELAHRVGRLRAVPLPD